MTVTVAASAQEHCSESEPDPATEFPAVSTGETSLVDEAEAPEATEAPDEMTWVRVAVLVPVVNWVVVETPSVVVCSPLEPTGDEDSAASGEEDSDASGEVSLTMTVLVTGTELTKVL